MTDRPTPETDAIEKGMFGSDAKFIADFARRLERERDEALDAAEKAKAYKRVMKEDNAKLRRELDELNKRLIEASSLGVDLLIQREGFRREFEAERALADRLADAVACLTAETTQGHDHIQSAFEAWKEARNGSER